MSGLTSIQIKAFVPAKDFDLSKRFYQDLGFELAWDSDDLATLRTGEDAFLLQKFYSKEHADNFMMHLLVDDVEAWWRRAKDVAAKYGVKAAPPEDRPWAQRAFTLIDPTGVLWWIAQNIGPPAPPLDESVFVHRRAIDAIAAFLQPCAAGGVAPACRSFPTGEPSRSRCCGSAPISRPAAC